MAKFYELTEQYKTIRDMLDGDLEYITRDEIVFTLFNIEDDIRLKIGSIGKLVLELKSDIVAVKTEEERLAKRRQGYNSKMEWLKLYLLAEMTKTNIMKIKEDVISVSVQDSPPSVEVIDIEEIPEAYIRIIPEQREADKRTILEHFKSTGEIISGTNLVLDKKHLVIR